MMIRILIRYRWLINLNCRLIEKQSPLSGIWGAWIAEWYHTWLWKLGSCTMAWAVNSSLGDNKLFIRPKHNIYTFSWFYFVYLIQYYYLSVKFVMCMNQKIENKNIFLPKIFVLIILVACLSYHCLSRRRQFFKRRFLASWRHSQTRFIRTSLSVRYWFSDGWLPQIWKERTTWCIFKLARQQKLETKISQHLPIYSPKSFHRILL